jgi:hypothetical protein
MSPAAIGGAGSRSVPAGFKLVADVEVQFRRETGEQTLGKSQLLSGDSVTHRNFLRVRRHFDHVTH